jgi:HSP20 family protein
MTLTRRPERTSAPIRDVVDWMFRDPWTSPLDDAPFGPTSIPLDVRETPDEIVVEAELPGIKPEETDVTIEGRTLTIRGRYAEEREEGRQGERYLLKERRAGQVTRTITLPSAIDADRVSCTYEQGELRIALPKAAESRARRIPIGAGAGTKQVGPSGG